MTPGVAVLLAAVALAVLFGGFRLTHDGRFRGTRAVAGAEPAGPGDDVPVAGPLQGTPYAGQLGERATLVQFSSAFCAPCRAARRVLGQAAEQHPGVVHLEVDAESHLDLVRAVGVLRTPTTLVLDGSGRERTRATGAPTHDQVATALGLVGVS